MITQFGSGGISLIFDKSVFHSLSYDEILILHKYYWVNVTPVLVMEILGDLKKETPEGDFTSKKVIEFAHKLHPFNSSISTYYLNLIKAELLGIVSIPFFKPLVDTGQVVEMPNGKKGMKINISDERLALDRWKEGKFLDAEKLPSQICRTSTTQPDLLTKMKENILQNESLLKPLRKQEDILAAFDNIISNPKHQSTILEHIIERFSIPTVNAGQIFYRYETSSEKNIQKFAPYTIFCLRANFLFYVSLQNDLINTRPTNLVDMEYVYYLPFCRIFLSNDKFHDKIIPYLINKNQRYIKGNEMKEDLKKILLIKKQLKGNDLIRAENEPPRDTTLLSYQLWKEMFVDWPPERDWKPSEEELQKAHDMITQMRNAKPI